MFIGNGGGVELAYDGGEFEVPGRTGKPKRIRFPAGAPDTEPKAAPVAPAPATIVAPPDAAAVEDSLDDVIKDIEEMEEGATGSDNEEGVTQSVPAEKEVTPKKITSYGEDLF